MAPQMDVKLTVWETGMVTSNPTPETRPEPEQKQPEGKSSEPTQPTKPRTRNMRSQLPVGKKSVAQYKAWLTAQLTAISLFDATDELDFNN